MHLHSQLEDWLVVTKNMFTFEILPLTFPEKNHNEWKNLFKPCAAQRLFLPVTPILFFIFKLFFTFDSLFYFQSLLKTVDSVLYVDTDTIFLSPVQQIWQFFQKFNASQIAGLSPEHEDKNVGWYNRFARHPFYGPLGKNADGCLAVFLFLNKYQ